MVVRVLSGEMSVLTLPNWIEVKMGRMPFKCSK